MSTKEPSVLPTTNPQNKLSDNDDNAESLHRDIDGKKPIRTWDDYNREWRTGSRKRALKYYVLWLMLGFLVGGAIGTAIGLAFRYT